MTIVSTGYKYSDIDAYACIIAYGELLEKLGIKAKKVVTLPFNSSVTKTVQSWNTIYETQHTDEKGDKYVLVDISEPDKFAKFVEMDRVIELFDHHFGYEEIWKNKLGEKSHIDAIGSCATLIWEEYCKNSLQDKISMNTANLLFTAIISNTLNFKAQITTNRDIIAAKSIFKYTDLDKSWIETYFNEVSESIRTNPLTALENDSKNVQIKREDYFISQIELWDSKEFLKKQIKKIENFFEGVNVQNKFLILSDISEGETYFFCPVGTTKYFLNNILDISWNGNIGKTNKLWLRKEIIRELQSYAN